MVFPFIPSFIWYMFASLNSLTRWPLFKISCADLNSCPPNFAYLEISRPSSFYPQWNNDDFYLFEQNSVNISVCQPNRSHEELAHGQVFKWILMDSNGEILETFVTEKCTLTWKAPEQGAFKVQIRLLMFDRAIKESEANFKVVDYWIAAIGDSFTSGEGNPDIPKNGTFPAQWLFRPCHRSKRSWPFKVFEKLKHLGRNKVGVHLTFLACSGASVEGGPRSLLKQLEKLVEVTRIRGRGPELLMMNAGGNDVGYSEILRKLLQGLNPMSINLGLRFFFVSHQLEKLAEVIRDEVRPSQVVIPTYFDLALNEKAHVDVSCQDLSHVTVLSMKKAQRLILKRLNSLIETKSREFGWTSVPQATEVFREAGACSKKSLIRSVSDAIRLQGDSGGSFHPVERAHELIAELVFSQIHFKGFLSH